MYVYRQRHVLCTLCVYSMYTLCVCVYIYIEREIRICMSGRGSPSSRRGRPPAVGRLAAPPRPRSLTLNCLVCVVPCHKPHWEARRRRC